MEKKKNIQKIKKKTKRKDKKRKKNAIVKNK